MDTHVKMSERRGRYKQLVDVNNLGGPSFSNTYAEFLQLVGVLEDQFVNEDMFDPAFYLSSVPREAIF